MSPISVETIVTDVTVYPDRARVTVSGHITVEEGPQRWIVDGLPLTMQSDSIRVQGAGDARVRLLSATVQRRHYEAAPAEKVVALEDEISGVENQLKKLADAQAVLQARSEHLDGLRTATTHYARGLARGEITVEDQSRLIEFLQEQDVTLRATARGLTQQQNNHQKRLLRLQRELKELQSLRPMERQRAVVEAEAASAGRFRLLLTYVVTHSGWAPLYDVRLNDEGDDRSLVVTSMAEVKQNTGQDWHNVRLKLSTARPALNQRLPDLNAWYIDVRRPKLVRPPMAMLSQTADAPAAMAVRSATPEMAGEETAAETAVANVTAVRFDVPGTVSVPSDGAPHKTTMFVEFLQPRLDYLAIPRHTDAVYRRAKVVNKSPAPWLSGPANLFVGDAFIGQTRLEYTPRGGELTLLLGVEERITVERELVRRDVEKRLLRDRRQLRYGYNIDLRNLMREPVEVTLRDQIPVAKHEEISVKLQTAQPMPDEVSDLNLLTWKIALPPDGAATTQFDFLVEYPQEMPVSGLPD